MTKNASWCWIDLLSEAVITDHGDDEEDDGDRVDDGNECGDGDDDGVFWGN